MRIIYSNFTNSNYIHLSKFNATSNFKFIINCVPVHGTTWNTLLSCHEIDRDFGLTSSNYWYWDNTIGTTSHRPISGQRYWICLYWTGSVYYFYYMEDDNTYTINTLPVDDFTNWTLAGSTNSTTNIYDNYSLDLGNWRGSNYPWMGSIDLYNTRIYADDSVWFDGPTQTLTYSGYYNNGCTISQDNIASNFSSSNYLIVNPIKYNYNSKNAKGIVRMYFVATTRPQDILARVSSADRCWCIQASNASNANKIDYYNGSSHIGVSILVTNNWYWFGYSWDGTTYKFYSMLDNGKYSSYTQLPDFNDPDWTSEMAYNDTNDLYETGFTFGYNIPANDGNRYWRGQIDLNNCILGNNIINYEVGKSGFITKSGMTYIKQNTTENITLDLTGITLTINPTPSDATVLLTTESGYKQTPNSNCLVAVEGTIVNYKVFKYGYSIVEGNYILTDTDHLINVSLEEGSNYEQPQIFSNGTWGTEGTLTVKTDNGVQASGYELYRAFNEDNTTGWHSQGTNPPFSVYMSLGQNVYIDKMSFINRTNDNQTWTARGGFLLGSNDGVNFNTIIATWTNDNTDKGGEWSFNVDNSQPWKYLKLYITNGSQYCCIKRIYITGKLV